MESRASLALVSMPVFTTIGLILVQGTSLLLHALESEYPPEVLKLPPLMEISDRTGNCNGSSGYDIFCSVCLLGNWCFDMGTDFQNWPIWRIGQRGSTDREYSFAKLRKQDSCSGLCNREGAIGFDLLGHAWDMTFPYVLFSYEHLANLLPR